jgi:hypothetical protein
VSGRRVMMSPVDIEYSTLASSARLAISLLPRSITYHGPVGLWSSIRSFWIGSLFVSTCSASLITFNFSSAFFLPQYAASTLNCDTLVVLSLLQFVAYRAP